MGVSITYPHEPNKTATRVGTGSYGTVQVVMRRATGELLAFKHFRLKEPLAEARELWAFREFSDFNHPNLLMLHAVVVDANVDVKIYGNIYGKIICERWSDRR